MLLADQQVNTGDGQHDGEQDDGGSRSIGRITAGVAVEHIVDITNDGIHFSRIQIGAKEGNRIGICLERADEAGDDEIKQGGGDHGQGDLREDSPFGSAVHLGGIVVGLIHRSKSAPVDFDRLLSTR